MQIDCRAFGGLEGRGEPVWKRQSSATTEASVARHWDKRCVGPREPAPLAEVRELFEDLRPTLRRFRMESRDLDKGSSMALPSQTQHPERKGKQ